MMDDGIEEKAAAMGEQLSKALIEMRNKVIAEGVNADEATNVMLKAASATLVATLVKVIANENEMKEGEVAVEAEKLYNEIGAVVNYFTLKILKERLLNTTIIEYRKDKEDTGDGTKGRRV